MSDRYDQNNIFAKILRKEIPSTPLYEDEYAYAFHDLYPQAPIHILVIPKGAYISMNDFTANASMEEIAGFFKAVGLVARNAGLADEGWRMASNIGENGGQEIPHLHIHILGGKKLGPLLGP
ncbi:histidine triad nucleotide-binding protein [Entomobacter blattae]|uniref:Purine nucleoside phosphoramidase n=1 Tax=Entomobacter blattae TaxID=2762277 RepID=A0A7H1NUN3_9PROT|nr:histidine triad nucleotide-binding protein [Entomobacter blattae]QNT79493.1 Purine nucleoside phosphoramidase [Entomobacter blattae]